MTTALTNNGYIIKRPVSLPSKSLVDRVAKKIEVFFMSIAKFLGYKPKPIAVVEFIETGAAPIRPYYNPILHEMGSRRHTTLDTLFKSYCPVMVG